MLSTAAVANAIRHPSADTRRQWRSQRRREYISRAVSQPSDMIALSVCLSGSPSARGRLRSFLGRTFGHLPLGLSLEVIDQGLSWNPDLVPNSDARDLAFLDHLVGRVPADLHDLGSLFDPQKLWVIHTLLLSNAGFSGFR